MRAAEIMTPRVKTVPPAMPVSDARRLMQDSRIHHLVVVADRKVVGVVSDRDIPRLGVTDATVGDVMTGSVVTACPDDTVRTLANRMRGRTVGCLPIVRGAKLVGIVTASDLLNVLGRGLDRPSQAQRHALRHRVPHRKSQGAFGMW